MEGHKRRGRSERADVWSGYNGGRSGGAVIFRTRSEEAGTDGGKESSSNCSGRRRVMGWHGWKVGKVGSIQLRFVSHD